MLDKLTPQQFADWERYFAIEPLGEDRDDFRMARITWAILQSQSKTKLDERKYLFDFQPRQPADPETYKRRSMAAWTGAGGGITIAEP